MRDKGSGHAFFFARLSITTCGALTGALLGWRKIRSPPPLPSPDGHH